MLVLPIPMIVALVLLALLVRAVVAGNSHATLLALIGLCAGQSAILALHHHYGFTVLRPVQPMTALLIPPAAWLALRHASFADVGARQIMLHGLAPTLAVFALVFRPAVLDLLIPTIFAAYGVAMLLALAKGEDSLPHSRLDAGGLSVLVWRVLALNLLASAALDVVIALSFASGDRTLPRLMASVLPSLSLLVLGGVSLSRALDSARGDDEDTLVPPTAEDVARDQTILARLDDYMIRQRPYLDPDLTLSRLARKITLPAKDLSAAINRGKGENVSRYINRQRVMHASTLLADGAAVTGVIYNSGFNTKSNFNREFLRVQGKSPTAWVSAHRASGS